MSILRIFARSSRGILLSTKHSTSNLKGSTLRQLSSNVATSGTLKVDSNNVISSPYQDIKGYENAYVHDAVWENLDKWSDKTALVCSVTGRSYTYGQCRKLCGKLAQSFRKAKLLPHDTIAIVLPNIPEYAIVLLAASEAGLRTTLINPEYDAVLMKRQMTDAEVVAVVTIPSKYNVVKKSIEGIQQIKLPIIMINDGSGPIPEGTIKLDDMMSNNAEFSKSEKTSVDYEDDVSLLYSSGTTGLPKGVQLSHRNIVSNFLQITTDEVQIVNDATRTFQDVVPVMLPIFHVYGFNVCVNTHLRHGAKLVFMPRFSMDGFIKAIEDYKPTLLYLVPPIIQMMTQDERVKPHHVESVKYIVSGAVPIQENTIAAFKSRIGSNVNFMQGYGMTETSPCITWGRDAPGDSIGYPVPNTQIRIVGCNEDNLGRNLGIAELGEVYVRGPQVMKGYFKNSVATKQTMDGDWIKTGDLACYTEKGIFYIQGRLKELIKVQGFQVAPAELEDIIRSSGQVKDVAVIGIPHEKYGEIPKAFIVPKDNIRLKADDIKEFVAQRVIKYKRLGDVKFVDNIPRTPAGKIVRDKVKNL